MEALFQFLGGGDSIIGLIYFIFFMVFFFFYPRLMLMQIMFKLEKTVNDLETMSDKSKKFIIKQIARKPTKGIQDSVNRFFEFFVIPPVSLDPNGIVPKLDHIMHDEKERFDYFVHQIAPKENSEKKANLTMGLAGGITLHEVAKIVRHYVELIKKTKSYQIALILQMQLPLIEIMAKSLYKGTRSLAKGEPIGDGVGPLIVAHIFGNKKITEIGQDVVMVKTNIMGRGVFALKAKGPGGRLGDPGKAVEKIVRKNKIERIITIDAAAKLEGEKTGGVAEGVGVAMGGPGVERSYIEGVAVKQKIPLDSIIVKMSPEEAITPMKKPIKDSVKEVMESVNRSLERTRKGSSVIIIGVGNTSGVGNSGKAARETENWVNKHHKKQEMKRKKRK